MNSFKTRFHRGIQLLKQFHHLHGNINIKQNFCIPHGETSHWAPSDAGFRLGVLVKYIRKQGPKFYQERNPGLFEELNQMGFCWNLNSYRHAKAVLAFTKFKEIYGHVHVNRNFAIPHHDDRWPKEVWGLKLGMIANRARNYELYNDIQKPLEELGFDFGYQKRPPNFDVIFQSLLVFKEKHGHLIVPLEYYVDSEDESYPEEIRGCNLGRSVANMRRKRYYKDQRDRLLSIGFPFCTLAESKFNLLYEALQMYKSIHGNFKVPRNFVIPKDSEHYPKRLWGLRLGNKMVSVRNFRAYREFAYRLAEIGLVVPQAMEYKAELDARREAGEDLEDEDDDEDDVEDSELEDQEQKKFEEAIINDLNKINLKSEK